MHLMAFSSLKPELLQALAGLKFWEEKLLRIIDSIFKTELPPVVHFRIAACYDIGNITKPRFSRQTPPGDLWVNSGSDDNTFRKAYVQMGQEVIGCTGIHGHVFPGACDPKYKDPSGVRICRFGKKSALNDGTTFIQLEKNPGNPKEVSICELDARPENTFRWNRPVSSTETSNRGLPAQDPRPLLLLTSRRPQYSEDPSLVANIIDDSLLAEQARSTDPSISLNFLTMQKTTQKL
jgi:hypothetical protein